MKNQDVKQESEDANQSNNLKYVEVQDLHFTSVIFKEKV